MKFVWGGERAEKNTELHFYCESESGFDAIELCAADFFRVFADGEFVSYGPERTAAGYARLRRVPLDGAKKITVTVSAYNAACYGCDMQLPYFGAVLYKNGKAAMNTDDFICYTDSARRRDVPRYGFQRGFTEVYDLRNAVKKRVNTYPVDAPVITEGNGDSADYAPAEFTLVKSGDFRGFDKVEQVWWKDNPLYSVPSGAFGVEKDLIKETEQGYKEYCYELSCERSGFIRVRVDAKSETKIFAVFDEILPDGKWIFRRSGCNDFVAWTLPKGKHTLISAEPYAFKHLKLLVKGDAAVSPELVTLENSRGFCVRVSGDERIESIMQAAEATYRQNSVDIFTDCPGRERAGWLCDSFFTAQAERLFTGENKTEKKFLENFLIAEVPEIADGMLPDCFPAEHPDAVYIPNWAMWFVIQLHDYLLRTGDGEFVAAAKPRVLKVVDFFDKYLNEYGLLENLEGWVFLEWSVSNDPSYVCGVNFPSNMLYARMLDSAYELYGIQKYKQRAEQVRSSVYKLSYTGEFYADNAVRNNGALIRCDDHVSETCQYYALTCKMPASSEYIKKMTEEFGPLRGKDVYPLIGRSNMFIGNYLRFTWLCDSGEYGRVLNECTEYFSSMARRTGTLWEKDEPTASCNHGFASSAAVFLMRCLTGYAGVKNGKAVFDTRYAPVKLPDCKIEFNYVSTLNSAQSVSRKK